MIKRLCVICEGQTEETFVRDVLKPTFSSLNLFVDARIIHTSPGNKGGALNYDRVKNFICKTLKNDKNIFVTTMFDLYALPPNFPRYDPTRPLHEKLKAITEAMLEDIILATQCDETRFIPYIQPYEFEALLFSDIDSWIAEESDWMSAGKRLKEICAAADSPEHINNNRDTKPSAHLEKYLKNPSYRKKLHGSRAAKKIGLANIEKKCSFFADWINRIRTLATQ